MTYFCKEIKKFESFYYCSTLYFEIPPALVFQLEVYYKLDRLLTGFTAQQIGTTARWHSNKTFLSHCIVAKGWSCESRNWFVFITSS